MLCQISRKYLVVVACLISQAVFYGIPFSSGVLYSEWSSTFSEVPRRYIALISSINNGMVLMCGPISSMIAEKFGLHVAFVIGVLISSLSMLCASFSTNIYVLMVTFGFGTGIGCSIATIPSAVLVNLYFKRHRILANGIASSGVGIGVVLGAPLLKILIDEYTWSGCLLLISAVFLQCLVFGTLMQAPSNPEEQRKSPSYVSSPEPCSTSRNTLISKMARVFKSGDFRILFCGETLWSFGAIIQVAMIYDASLNFGHSRWHASFAMTLIGVGNATGRVLIGTIFNFQQKLNVLVVPPVSILVSGAAIMLVPFVGQSYGCLITVCLLYGFSFGSYKGVLVPVTLEILPVELVVIAFAWIGIFSGVMILIAPPFAGFIYDQVQNYSTAFIIGGISNFVSSLLLTTMLYRNKNICLSSRSGEKPNMVEKQVSEISIEASVEAGTSVKK